jgi:hypothetical protein
MPVEIIDILGPKNNGDFATHSSEFSKGGFREVADIAARDAITTQRRTEGMHVYVVDTDETYRLESGLGNGDWVLATTGTASGGGTYFVFQPGGTQSGNVYTDFADLVTAYNAQAQPSVIRLDTTFAVGSVIPIPSGSHDFNRPAIIFCPILNGALLRFESGATMTGVAEIVGCIIDVQGADPVIVPTATQIGLNIKDGFIQSTGAGGALIELPPGQVFRMRITNADMDGGTTLIDVGAGSTFILSLLGSTTVGANSIDGTGTINVEINADSVLETPQNTSVNTIYKGRASSLGFQSNLAGLGFLETSTSDATVNDLLEYFDSNYKPFWPTVDTQRTLSIRTTGNDDTGDGTVGAPFATIQRALQLVPQLNGAASRRVTLDIGPGSFTMPNTLEANYTDFFGTTSVEDTLTIDTVIAADNDRGIVLDVTSTGGPYSADELRGRHIIWTSGTSNGNEGWIYRSDATSSGVTRIYATQDSGTTTGIESMSATDTIDLINLETTIEWEGGSGIIQNSVQCNFRDLNVGATGATNVNLFLLTTDKIDFDRCFFDSSDRFKRLQCGGFGRVFLTNCYYAGKGPFGSEAFLAAKNNGFMQISRGTVLDASFGETVGSRRWVEISAGSLLAFSQHVVCRGFDSGRVFEADGAGIFFPFGIQASSVLLMEDSDGASTNQTGPVFAINDTGKGQGGWYQFPNLHGSITGDYVAKATGCACVILGETSDVTTAIGTNTVSADNGVSNIASQTDGTIIFNASPEALGFELKTSIEEITATSYTVSNSDGIILVNQTADSAVTIDLPPGDDHITKQITVKDKKGTAGTRNVTINADGAETIDGSGSVVLSANYASVILVFSGTEWSLI